MPMPMPFALAWRRWRAGAARRGAPVADSAAAGGAAVELVDGGADVASASADAADAFAALADSSDFFQRLTGDHCVAEGDAPPHEQEDRFLERVRALLDSGEPLAPWVPRPPSMLPRLLACLRGAEPSLRDASALVRADPQLVVEIVRQANSARMQHAAPVADLEHAVLRLGVDGLLRVAGSSVMRPLYDARQDELLARAAPKLSKLALAKSLLCYMQAPRSGVDAFDAYLAGLTHNVGWVGVLRALGRHEPPAPRPYSRSFVVQLSRLSERMYGASAEQWQINEALTGLGSALRESTLGQSTLPLARVLWRAENEVVRKLLAA
jgi:hypothetical protein